MTTVDRRSLLKAGGLTAGAAVLGSTALQAVSMRMAEAAPGSGRGDNANVSYGPLVPKTSLNDGQQWLALLS